MNSFQVSKQDLIICNMLIFFSTLKISITPTRQKPKVPEGREPTIVIMAPFTPKAVVTFDGVPCTKTARRILRVQNPSENEIEVFYIIL